jgi:7-keto-8-aminopelargonate synthetase-like enzyme
MRVAVLPARAARGAVLCVAAAALASSIAACGSSKSSNGSSNAKANLDTHKVALAIEQSIRNERHIQAKVVCPTTVPQQAGRTFVCIAATVPAHKRRVSRTPFEVKVQNDKGFVTYQAK